MAGHFELFNDRDGRFKVKWIDGQGNVLAVSAPYTDSNVAVREINRFREVAATAPVEDHTSTVPQTPDSGLGQRRSP
jgi:uncharacterized protein YegP (UPF0339 family)